jgi:hypothetical protein
MKRFTIILATLTTTILANEASANGRGHARPVSGGHSRPAVTAHARPHTTVHRPSTGTHVRPVTPRSVHPGPATRITRPVTPPTRGHGPAGFKGSGPTRRAPQGFFNHARRFSGGHWFRSRPSVWTHRFWHPHHRCWCWRCPVTSCDYYWCGPYNAYFPITYCPTGSYDYPLPDDLGPIEDEAPIEEQPPFEEPSRLP